MSKIAVAFLSLSGFMLGNTLGHYLFDVSVSSVFEITSFQAVAIFVVTYLNEIYGE